MGSDPRTAIYAVRLLNVLLSALLLVCVPLLLRRVFPIRQSLAVLVALALLLSPGMSLRNSQVTNQVLAGLLVTVLYLLLGQQASSPPRRGFLEGAIAALAILTKLTAVAVLPSLVLAWWKRTGGVGLRVLAGGAGFALPSLLWLAWALPVYGQPLPLAGRHPFLREPRLFAFPDSSQQWIDLGGRLVQYFWLPWEWQARGVAWHWFILAAQFIATGAVVLAIIWSVAGAGHRADSLPVVAVRLSLMALAGLVAGYLVFVLTTHRIFETDLRELYIMIGPLAVLLAAFAARFQWPVSAALSGGLVTAWLVTDIGLYVVGHCIRCYP